MTPVIMLFLSILFAGALHATRNWGEPIQMTLAVLTLSSFSIAIVTAVFEV